AASGTGGGRARARGGVAPGGRRAPPGRGRDGPHRGLDSAGVLAEAEDPDTWGVAGMLHDFDYEVHPRGPHHPMKGGEILLVRGVPLQIVYAVLAHADYSGMPRVSLLDRALYACDELSGFVHAVALVRPGRVITGLAPPSVRQKLKDKAFARTVSRDDVYRGAAELGVDLDEHIAFVIAALAGVASEIGLARA